MWSTQSLCRDCMLSCFACKAVSLKLQFDVPMIALDTTGMNEDEPMTSAEIDGIPIDAIIAGIKESPDYQTGYGFSHADEMALRGTFEIDRLLSLKVKKMICSLSTK